MSCEYVDFCKNFDMANILIASENAEDVRFFIN